MTDSGKKDMRPQGSWEMQRIYRAGQQQAEQLAIESVSAGHSVLIDTQNKCVPGRGVIPFYFIQVDA